jgi:hypothetical protein
MLMYQIHWQVLLDEDTAAGHLAAYTGKLTAPPGVFNQTSAQAVTRLYAAMNK